MRRTAHVLGVMMMGMLLAANADAASITDTHNPADILMSHLGNNCQVTVTAPCDTYAYTHNILDDGYAPATHTLLSALLTITLRDDNDNSADKVQIFLDGTEVSPPGAADGGVNFTYNFGDVTVFANLASDGMLNVLLDAQAGDFFFDRSDLEVNFERKTTDVPEPASLLLFGTALAGLASQYRKRQQSR